MLTRRDPDVVYVGLVLAALLTWIADGDQSNVEDRERWCAVVRSRSRPVRPCVVSTLELISFKVAGLPDASECRVPVQAMCEKLSQSLVAVVAQRP